MGEPRHSEGGRPLPLGSPKDSGTESNQISARSSCRSWRAPPPRCRRSTARMCVSTRSPPCHATASSVPIQPPPPGVAASRRTRPRSAKSLTALNPRGGGAEADDQARPVSGAALVPGSGSILRAKRRRRWTALDLRAAARRQSSGSRPNYNFQTALRGRVGPGSTVRACSESCRPIALRGWATPLTRRPEAPVNDVCGKLFPFLPTPRTFCRKCPCSAPGGVCVGMGCGRGMLWEGVLPVLEIRTTFPRIPCGISVSTGDWLGVSEAI